VAIALILLLSLPTAVLGYQITVQVEIAHVDPGQAGSVRILCSTDIPLSALRIPIQIADNSDIVIDSISYVHSVAGSNFIVYSPISDTANIRRGFINVLPPAHISPPTLSPPGGEICRIYFHVLPSATPGYTPIDSFYTIHQEGNQTWDECLDASDRSGNTVYPAFIAGGIWVEYISAVAEDQSAVPGGFSLEQNFPNPFNPSTSISFSLARSGWVSLGIYDLAGRRVALLAEGRYAAGRYRVEWDGSRSPSGVYFCHLKTTSGASSRKMLLLK
jgi:hypothetical protein